MKSPAKFSCSQVCTQCGTLGALGWLDQGFPQESGMGLICVAAGSDFVEGTTRGSMGGSRGTTGYKHLGVQLKTGTWVNSGSRGDDRQVNNICAIGRSMIISKVEGSNYPPHIAAS